MKRVYLLALMIVVSASLIAALSFTTVFRSFSLKDGKFDYEKLWHEADSLKDEGLPKEAMELVDLILNKAREQKDQPQWVKALLYKEALRSNFEERHLEESITAFNKELKILPEPALQIIKSALAELYLSYFRANQYEITQRTAFGKPGEVPEKWSLAQISKLIDSTYSASLDNQELLSAEKMENWAPAFKNVLSVKGSAYSLYDVLAGRALMFYASGESNLIELPAEAKSGTPFLFTPARTFALSRMAYHEGSPFFLRALSIYRQLLSDHLNDKQPDILIDIDLHRLKWAKEWGNVISGDSLYRESVKSLYSAFKNAPAGMSAGYELANSIYQQGINANNPVIRNSHLADAATVASEVIHLFPQSRGAAECRQLLHELTLPELTIQTPETYLPGDPITFGVKRKNCETLNFRIVELSKEDLQRIYLNYRFDNKLAYNEFKTIREWKAPLPSETPWVLTEQKVTTEELPIGAYLLLASTSSSFGDIGSPVAMSLFQITNLGWMVQSARDIEKLVVVDRRTGKPESGVEVTLFSSYQTAWPSQDRFDTQTSQISDKSGFIKIELPQNDRSRSVFVSLTNGNDYYFGKCPFYYIGKEISDFPKDNISEKYFTDRAIYRPGQKVFFKGISFKEKDYKYEVLSDHSVKVSFFDANNRLIDNQDFITNRYGSFSGSFTIPQNLMSGYYRISSLNGYVHIQVEDYKRPSFAVNLFPYEGVPKPGDEVEIHGKAEAFSGFPIGGGKVSYTVKRKIWMPFFRFMIQDQGIELIHGETITDSDGMFTIRFNATVDKNLKNSDNLTYYFDVSADVIDPSGETQTGDYTLAVSKQNLLIEANIPNNVVINRKDPVNVKVVNLAGKSVPSNFTAELYRLNQPDSSYWNLNLNKLFPNDGGSEELNLWPVGAYVSSFSLVTSKDSLLYLNKLIKHPGAYLLRLKASDGAGNSAIRESRIIAYDENSKLLPARLPFWFVPLSERIKSNDPIVFLLGSSEKKANILINIYRNDTLIDNRWIVIDNKQEKMILPCSSSEGDKFAISIAMVRNNHLYETSSKVEVEELKNALDIRFMTYRSMLTPGGNETWRVKINRKDGQILPSEMVVGMYDASLDQFDKHSWEMYFNKRGFPLRNWLGLAFTTGWTNQRFIDTVSIESPVMNLHPYLNWFDYQFYGSFGIFRSGKMLASSARKADGVSEPILLDSSEEVMENEVVMDDAEFFRKASFLPFSGKDKSYRSDNDDMTRKNLQETAFFFPHLLTNDEGEVEFSFKVPGSLTSWHVLAFAHTKDLAFGITDLYVKTQRQLMVMPQLPRYFRGGDTIAIPVKVVNLLNKPVNAIASFVLVDLVTGKSLDWSPADSSKAISVNPGATTIVSWKVIVPENPGMIVYRAKVSSETHSDGEENIIPVLSGRKWFVSSQVKNIKGQVLWQPDLSSGVDWKEGQEASLTVEYIENPAWFVVQALPQIKSVDNKGLNLVLNNYYAANMGLSLMKSQPAIMNVVRSWSNNEANISPLLKNEEVKILTNNQTPWVQEAIDESNDLMKITTFFNDEELKISSEEAFRRLKELQLANGGFSWYEGMADSKYLTAEVVQTLGRMKKMTAIDPKLQPTLERMVSLAINYLDGRMIENWKLDSIHKVKSSTIDPDEIKYLYARSFWLKEYSLQPYMAKVYKSLLNKLQMGVLKADPAVQATAAVVFSRAGDQITAHRVVKSLKSKALSDKDGFIFWRKTPGYHWYEDPLRTQVLALEAIIEVEADMGISEKIRSWLLAQRQTQSWESRSSNADIAYAFILNGSSIIDLGNPAEITLEGKKLESMVPSMAGSGWFKAQLHPTSMDQLKRWRLEIRGKGTGMGWASLWIKYKGQQSHAVSSESGVKIERAIFLMKGNSSTATSQLTKGTPLKQGDRLRIQLTITTDRDMDFVALTDQRASGLEPGSRSGFLWKGGRGYYQEVKDNATQFFFDRLDKGTRTIEYEVIVAHAGTFSDGPAEIQSLYAPAFSGRSEGNSIKVKN